MDFKAKISLYLTFLLGLLLIVSCKKDTKEEQVTPVQPIESTAQRSGLLLAEPGAYQRIPLIDEPLVNARTSEKTTLPDEYIIPGLVPVGNQGDMESCVGWATAYAARTLLYQRGKPVNYLSNDGQLLTELVFSPEFVWTSINQGQNKGVLMADAMNLIQQVGVARYRDFPTRNQPAPKPTGAQNQSASTFKVKNWGRIAHNAATFRKFLYYDNPIIIAIKPDENFKKPAQMLPDGSLVWDNYGTPGAGHACTIVGYSKERNAFLVQNSWGKRWGDRLTEEDAKKPMAGFIWLDYNLLEKVVTEAYVMIANDPGYEKPVVNTWAAGSESENEITLNGSVEKFEDKALSEYGFLVSTDSTGLELGGKAESIQFHTILAPPYSFAKTYTSKGAGKRFYRAYAKSYSEVYYGKIVAFTVQPEIEDSGRLSGNIVVSTNFENRYTKADNGYTEYNSIREYKFEITFSEKHPRYRYRALYLFTANGSYFAVRGISEGPEKDAVAYLDLSYRSWEFPFANGQIGQGSALPDVPLYRIADLEESPKNWTIGSKLINDLISGFMVVMSDDPDFEKNVIATDQIAFPMNLNSDSFKPTEIPPQPLHVAF
ncbi:C1 family peptidase [Dyadobacter fermentans]|uniref:Peptidase C1A papain n=1 Tax=Dyadobacter fermentans (strain ATCC 700827 / DSM 18053 / CIP 107007 / KCTC 52180 / NS114) TaxID=471854 RepID=C6W064_DYAFD|nr:C1 family peptidase [Dyadobacter fermentans]ACT95391.1 peptidase C1A papain [Dyadobacter fermentans DSM 18053]